HATEINPEPGHRGRFVGRIPAEETTPRESTGQTSATPPGRVRGDPGPRDNNRARRAVLAAGRGNLRTRAHAASRRGVPRKDGGRPLSTQRDGVIAMAQKTVQLIIGQILTDEELRASFLKRPIETLATLRGMGFELTQTEVEALAQTDRRLWRSGPEWLDSRLRRAPLI